MGNTYTFKGEPDKSIECYRKAVEIKPDKIEAWFNLALKHRELGDYGQAEECIQKVVKLRPDFSEGRRLLNTIKREKENL